MFVNQNILFPKHADKSGVRTIYVSRHAKTVGNEQQVFQEWFDYDLSTVGVGEARVAREWWKKRSVSRIVSSPLLRARRTAILLFGREADELDAGWVELAVPTLAGLPLGDAVRRMPNVLRADGWPRFDASLSGQHEHVLTVAARTVDALRRAALSVPAGSNVAVVTHGAPLFALLTVAGVGESSPVGVVGNLATVEVTVDPAAEGGWSVVAVHHPLNKI